LAVGVRRLVENDGIQLLIGVAADLAAVAALGVAVAQLLSLRRVAMQQALAQEVAQPVGLNGEGSGDGSGEGIPLPGVLPAGVAHALEPLLAAGYEFAAIGQPWSRP
jgi:hypothetical protein